MRGRHCEMGLRHQPEAPKGAWSLRRAAKAGLLLATLLASAQGHAGEPSPAQSFLSHPTQGELWVSGQLNVIAQYHPPFPARYSAIKANSLSPRAEVATSFVATVFAGVRLARFTELLVDSESAGGRGLSDALGLAGFTNLDVVRN